MYAESAAIKLHRQLEEAPIEPLLTIPDVEELLGVSRPGIYRLVRAGELPMVKIGARVRFEQSDVAALVARGRSPYTPIERDSCTVA